MFGSITTLITTLFFKKKKKNLVSENGYTNLSPGIHFISLQQKEKQKNNEETVYNRGPDKFIQMLKAAKWGKKENQNLEVVLISQEEKKFLKHYNVWTYKLHLFVGK